MTTVIVGIGVLALMELLASGTVSNVRGTEMTTGVNLAKNIREMALQKTFAELPAMHNASYKPAGGQPRRSAGGHVGVVAGRQGGSGRPQPVDHPPARGVPARLRITATINRNGRKVCDLQWFSFAGLRSCRWLLSPRLTEEKTMRPALRQFHPQRRRGATAVLAMLYLVLFSTLALGFYAATTTAVQVSHNDSQVSRAFLASESGLDFMRYHLSRVSIPAYAPADSVPPSWPMT